jgi:hypothetical protein
MRRPLCIFFLVSLPTVVFANTNFVGRISLYGDAASTQCALADNEPRLGDVFLVHNIGPIAGNAYLVRFRLTVSAGFTGPWVQDFIPVGMSAIGTSPNGIAISYQACRTGDVQILRATYQLFGTSSPCSSVQATAYPGADFIETMDCSFDSYAVEGGTLFINANESCPCQETVAVEPSTWGRVKALYFR